MVIFLGVKLLFCVGLFYFIFYFFVFILLLFLYREGFVFFLWVFQNSFPSVSSLYSYSLSVM